MIYEVFARKTRGEPLRHIGNLNAPDDDLAKVYAFNTYDEEKWFDMHIVQRGHLLEVYSRLDAADTGERAAVLAERAAGQRAPAQG